MPRSCARSGRLSSGSSSGAGTSRARDYYDLWSLLRQEDHPIDRGAVAAILDAKMAARGVAFQGVDDFFAPQLVAEARRTWQANLGTFVPSLPDVEAVLDELRPLIAVIAQEARARAG